MATGTTETVNHSTIHDDEIAVVTCETSKGTMVWELYRYWSPAGYDQLVSLMERRYFDHSHFFRTVPDFLVQFGISYTADKALQSLANQQIPDDPQHEPPIPFTFGTISYAGMSFHMKNSSELLCRRLQWYVLVLTFDPFSCVLFFYRPFLGNISSIEMKYGFEIGREWSE
jgi:Cyclophilin type peptidyl-prolyl cis-trans isomerase/CLD